MARPLHAILNSVQNSNYKENVKEEIAKMGTYSIELTVSNISEVLNSLKECKSCGLDGVAAQQFVYAQVFCTYFHPYYPIFIYCTWMLTI